MITATELCPRCGLESTHHTSVEDLKRTHGKAFCEKCGEKILLCSICKAGNCKSQPNCFEIKEDNERLTCKEAGKHVPVKSVDDYLCPECNEFVGSDNCCDGDGLPARYEKNYCEMCGTEIMWDEEIVE